MGKCQEFPNLHPHQYSIEVTNGTKADFPEIVVEIKDIEESPYNYTVNGTQEKIGFILHSDDEKTAYTGV